VILHEDKRERNERNEVLKRNWQHYSTGAARRGATRRGESSRAVDRLFTRDVDDADDDAVTLVKRVLPRIHQVYAIVLVCRFDIGDFVARGEEDT